MKTIRKTSETVKITEELWKEYSRDGKVFLYKDDNDEWAPAVFVNKCYCHYKEIPHEPDAIAAAVLRAQTRNYFAALDLDFGSLFLLQIGQEIKTTRNAVLTYEE